MAATAEAEFRVALDRQRGAAAAEAAAAEQRAQQAAKAAAALAAAAAAGGLRSGVAEAEGEVEAPFSVPWGTRLGGGPLRIAFGARTQVGLPMQYDADCFSLHWSRAGEGGVGTPPPRTWTWWRCTSCPHLQLTHNNSLSLLHCTGHVQARAAWPPPPRRTWTWWRCTSCPHLPLTHTNSPVPLHSSRTGEGGVGTSTTSDLDLVALHQLAAATARAETAELRLADMERVVGAARVGVFCSWLAATLGVCMLE